MKGVDAVQINNLLAGSSDPMSVGKRNNLLQAGDRASAAVGQEAAATAEGSSALRRIASQYDVREITPRDFSEMLQKLYKAGALGEEQWQELAVARLDLDLENIDPDETIDLVDFYADKLDKLLREQADSEGLPGTAKADRPLLEPVQQLLSWMEKFALIQSVDTIGIDALV